MDWYTPVIGIGMWMGTHTLQYVADFNFGALIVMFSFDFNVLKSWNGRGLVLFLFNNGQDVKWRLSKFNMVWYTVTTRIENRWTLWFDLQWPVRLLIKPQEKIASYEARKLPLQLTVYEPNLWFVFPRNRLTFSSRFFDSDSLTLVLKNSHNI